MLSGRQLQKVLILLEGQKFLHFKTIHNDIEMRRKFSQ